LGSRSKLTLMKLSLSGTELLKFYLDKNNTQLQLIFGQLEPYLLKWLKGELSLLVTLRLIRFSRSSKSKELLMKTIGLLLSNSQTSNLPSPNGKVYPSVNIHKTWMSMVWTCWLAWLLWNLTSEFLAGWRCNILTLTTWTKAKS
jgi:hypothetical protein